MQLQELEKEIKIIKERNNRVEAEKAWETSLFRILLISSLTYIAASIIFYLIGVKDYLLNALIPAVAYFLSTQSLPFVKKWWIRKYSDKRS